MIVDLISNWNDLGPIGIAALVISYAALVLVMLPIHELAHAFAATKLGDNTARWHGRLRLNPLAHLDPFGTAMLVFFGYGFAKPVPVNPRNFRNPKLGMALTALAGPLSNLLMAALSLGLFSVIVHTGWYRFLPEEVFYFLFLMLVVVFANVNLGLAVFNLLPVPPLDGSKILEYFLPARWSYPLERYGNYMTWGLMFLVFSGYLNGPLDFLQSWIGGILCAVFRLPNYFG